MVGGGWRGSNSRSDGSSSSSSSNKKVNSNNSAAAAVVKENGRRREETRGIINVGVIGVNNKWYGCMSGDRQEWVSE